MLGRALDVRAGLVAPRKSGNRPVPFGNHSASGDPGDPNIHTVTSESSESIGCVVGMATP